MPNEENLVPPEMLIDAIHRRLMQMIKSLRSDQSAAEQDKQLEAIFSSTEDLMGRLHYRLEKKDEADLVRMSELADIRLIEDAAKHALKNIKPEIYTKHRLARHFRHLTKLAHRKARKARRGLTKTHAEAKRSEKEAAGKIFDLQAHREQMQRQQRETKRKLAG